MSSVRRRGHRSFGLRLAIFSGITTFFTSCVLMAVVGWIATATIYDTLGDALTAEAQELVGLADVQRPVAIAEREQARRSRFSYLLIDAAGARIAGSLPQTIGFAPGLSDLAWPSEAQHPAPPQDDQFERLIVYTVTLPAGGYLVVGADGESLVEAEEAIMEAGAWGIPLAALASFLGAAGIGARYRRRMEEVAARADAVMGDQLMLRMPVSASGDEIDRLATALNAMLDRLAASMEGLRQISNDIAHELRTPLSRLHQSLESALTLPDRKGLLAAIDDAAAEAQTLLDIFAALLRIAQIEGGSPRASFSRVDLSLTLSQIAETYGPVAEDEGRSLQAGISPGLVVTGDRELLLQMFANIIENALRHTPSGASVVLGLDRVEGRVVAVVEDDGPGISLPHRDKVFQRFYRADTARSTPGSGLGLALVAAIAEVHGAIVVLDDAQPGLRVTVTFGATRPSSPHSNLTQTQAPGP